MGAVCPQTPEGICRTEWDRFLSLINFFGLLAIVFVGFLGFRRVDLRTSFIVSSFLAMFFTAAAVGKHFYMDDVVPFAFFNFAGCMLLYLGAWWVGGYVAERMKH